MHSAVFFSLDGAFFCARSSVRLFNVGLHFLAAKVAFSWPSVDRFGKFWGGFMTLGQVKSLQNFC